MTGRVSLAGLRGDYGGNAAVNERLGELERYFAWLAALGVAPWVDLDLTIVRGLAYYTGIVFELFDAHGEFRAICGGGRYDTLLQSLGGVDLPALGFGMGDVVLGELLRHRGLMPTTLAGGPTTGWRTPTPGSWATPCSWRRRCDTRGRAWNTRCAPQQLGRQFEGGVVGRGAAGRDRAARTAR